MIFTESSSGQSNMIFTDSPDFVGHMLFSIRFPADMVAGRTPSI